MTPSYLDENDLKTAFDAAEAFNRNFHVPLNENERLASAKPGYVPKGKPKVTDGTLASIVKEAPKRVLQQLPTGKVSVKIFPDIDKYVNAVLTDDILVHANSGGRPFSKFRRGIKKSMIHGASIAYCFYNRRGDWFGADFRLVNPRDVYLEEGKTSEFDSNVQYLVGWYTKADLQVTLDIHKKLSSAKNTLAEPYEPEWDTVILQELIDCAVQEKDQENKTSTEQKTKVYEDNGYIKLVHCFQVGVGATFYTWSPKLDKVARRWKSKDPRGIIPLHWLHYEEEDDNPLGTSLISFSAGKQNLLDFDMQAYQYQRGMQMSPTLLKWGAIPNSRVKNRPDGVIDMGPTVNATKLDVLSTETAATRDWGSNYGLLKSQILNDSGMIDTSISASVGNPGFSKTSKGVDSMTAKLGVSDNAIRKDVEDWIERIYETLLNIHFSTSTGSRELELRIETLKALKLNPKSKVKVDYSLDYGKIGFTVDAGTTEASDSQQESEKLMSILDTTSKYGSLPPHKNMIITNQLIKNSGADDYENLVYTDEEIDRARQTYEEQVQLQKQQMEAQAQMQMQQAAASQQQPSSVQTGQIPTSVIPTDQTGADTELGVDAGMDNDEDEAQARSILQARGVPMEDIDLALSMIKQDVSDEQVTQILIGARQ